MKLKDRTGEVFGKLTVIEYRKNLKWLCRCECGQETLVLTNSLVQGLTKSCGCELRRTQSEYGQRTNYFQHLEKYTMGVKQ